MDDENLKCVVQHHSTDLIEVFKQNLVHFANEFWSCNVITGAAKDNLLDPSKGGADLRASNLVSSICSTLSSLRNIRAQSVHMLFLLSILEKADELTLAKNMRIEVAKMGIDLPPHWSTRVSDHEREFHDDYVYGVDPVYESRKRGSGPFIVPPRTRQPKHVVLLTNASLHHSHKSDPVIPYNAGILGRGHPIHEREFSKKQFPLSPVPEYHAETSQLHQYGDVVSKLRETQYQLQAALQRVKELKNENDLIKTMCRDKDGVIKKLEATIQSNQKRLQGYEDKLSLLITDAELNDEIDEQKPVSQRNAVVEGNDPQSKSTPTSILFKEIENDALSDGKDSELEMLKSKLKTKDESIKALIEEKDVIKKTCLIKDKDLTYLKGAMKSSQENMQDLETKLLLTTVKKPVSQRDAIVQFDYWVPMEDLLHGAYVVDERVFNVQGDKEQYFNWNECGFTLYIPAGALLPTETCPVAVKAIIAGRFILPKRTELVSAFYAISASRKLRKKVKTELQHCLLLENEAQTKHLHFIKAHQTNPGLPYHFELQPGGEFMVNTRYAALWQSEFSIEAIVKVQPYPDDESGSNNEGSGNGPENSTEEEGDQNQEDDQNTDEVTSKEGSDESHDRSDDEHINSLVLVDNEEEDQNTDEVSSKEGKDESHSRSNDDEHISSNELLVNTTDSQECPNDEDVNQSIKSQKVEPNTQLTINLQSKNTPTKQITDFDNGLYRAHTFYEKVSGLRHKWIFKFAAIKHLNVHIKYIEESDTLKHLEKAESFEFRFKEDPQGYICLNVSNRESLPNGWRVCPYSLPCGVSKRSIDLLATQFKESPDSSVLHVYPVIPMCMVSIHADADASLCLEYEVPVEGIVETKTIFIMRSVASEISRSPGATQQEQEKEEAESNSIEQQGVQESKLQATDFSDVISATRMVANWFTLGIFLKIDFEQLKTIEKDYPGNQERCRQEMLSNWIRLGNATWSILVNVLYSDDVKEKAVAEEIAKKYLKKQL